MVRSSAQIRPVPADDTGGRTYSQPSIEPQAFASTTTLKLLSTRASALHHACYFPVVTPWAAHVADALAFVAIAWVFAYPQIVSVLVMTWFCLGAYAWSICLVKVCSSLMRLGVLPQIVEYCKQDDAEIKRCFDRSNREQILHHLNVGGVIACLVLLFAFGFQSETRGSIIATFVLAGCFWVICHLFIFWGCVTLMRLCCFLLAVTAKTHICRIREILRSEELSPVQKLRALSEDQAAVDRIFAKANAAITAPMVVSAGIIFGLVIIFGLNIYVDVAKAEPVSTILAQGVLLLLAIMGGFLVLVSLTSVAEEHDAEADKLHHSLDLINRAEEVFPGNGTGYLDNIHAGQSLSLKFLRVPLNGRLLGSAIFSLVATIAITVIFNTVSSV